MTIAGATQAKVLNVFNLLNLLNLVECGEEEHLLPKGIKGIKQGRPVSDDPLRRRGDGQRATGPNGAADAGGREHGRNTWRYRP